MTKPHGTLSNLPPPTFTPTDPEGLYAALMTAFASLPADIRQFSDPSAYYADAWCAYLRERGNKAGDQKAKELRWFAHEWRRRTCRPMEQVNEAWTNTAPTPEPVPMRQIPIQQHASRGQKRKPREFDPVYDELPALYAAGLSNGEIGKRIGKSTDAVYHAIKLRIEAGQIEAR